MVRLTSPGGIEVLACEEAVTRLLDSRFARADDKPKQAAKPNPKSGTKPAVKSTAKTKGA